MKRFSKIIKKCGFIFSFKRLKKALLLVILFSLIGFGVNLVYKFNSSESGLKLIYEKELASKYDLGENSVIRIYKKDLDNDEVPDYVFILGKEKRTSGNILNSTVELYQDVSFVIVNGSTNEVTKYDTEKEYKADVNLKIVEDEQNRYYLISDYNGDVDLLETKDGSVVNITKNTTDQGLLGYTIYTSKDEENSKIKISLDNYNKNYLNEDKDEKQLDLSELSLDLPKYRETYLRDRISKFDFRDTNNDGILEFVTTQYVLYSLDESLTENKTVGKVEIFYDIKEYKLVFNRVEINI